MIRLEVVDKKFRDLALLHKVVAKSDARKISNLAYFLHATKFMAIYNDRDLIGFTYVLVDRRWACILYIFIESEFQNKGFGKETLKALEENFANYEFYVYIEEDSSLNSFFEKCGYYYTKYRFIQEKYCYVYGKNAIFSADNFASHIKKLSNGFVKINLRIDSR